MLPAVLLHVIDKVYYPAHSNGIVKGIAVYHSNGKQSMQKPFYRTKKTIPAENQSMA